MNTGEKIRRCREALGLSQAELATRSGVTQKRISVIETGDGRAYGDQVKSLADALNVSTEYLLDPEAIEPFQPLGELERRVWHAVKEIGYREAYGRLLGKPVKSIGSAGPKDLLGNAES